MATELGLIGDIGATNARFSLVRPDGSMTEPRVFSSGETADIVDVVEAYLRAEAPERPTAGVLAIAAAIRGDRVSMTNHPWTFSIEALRKRLGLRRLDVINDFVAKAASLPELAPGDIERVGPGYAAPGEPAVVLGPGTGLGMSILAPGGSGMIPLPSEGGHVTMSARNDREAAVLDLMRGRFDHVSAERVLSGPGLVNLYNALCELDAIPAAALQPAQITDPSAWAENAQAREATSMFCAMLGTVASCLALTLCARGGVYIAGGVAPRLGAIFTASGFRARFEDMGRFRGYLREIPTFVIVRPLPALVGAAKLLQRD